MLILSPFYIRFFSSRWRNSLTHCAQWMYKESQTVVYHDLYNQNNDNWKQKTKNFNITTTQTISRFYKIAFFPRVFSACKLSLFTFNFNSSIRLFSPQDYWILYCICTVFEFLIVIFTSNGLSLLFLYVRVHDKCKCFIGSITWVDNDRAKFESTGVLRIKPNPLHILLKFPFTMRKYVKLFWHGTYHTQLSLHKYQRASAWKRLQQFVSQICVNSYIFTCT